MAKHKATKRKRLRKQARMPLVRLSSGQVGQALRHILTSTLALYVLKNSQKPSSGVIESLMKMEVKAAQLIGLIMQMQADGVSRQNLEGTLAGVCSFIPFPALKVPQSQSSKT